MELSELAETRCWKLEALPESPLSCHHPRQYKPNGDLKHSAASSQGMLGTTGVSSMGRFTQEVENMSSAGILKMAPGGRDTPNQVYKTDHVPSSGQYRENTVLYLAHPEGLSSSLAAPWVAKVSFPAILTEAGDLSPLDHPHHQLFRDN